MGFPGGSDSKESTYNVRDLGSIPGLRRSPRGGHSNPLQYSCLENPHGQRSLVGYSPWGRKESDTTERQHGMEGMGVGARHQYSLEIPRWFQFAVKFGNHSPLVLRPSYTSFHWGNVHLIWQASF